MKSRQLGMLGLLGLLGAGAGSVARADDVLTLSIKLTGPSTFEVDEQTSNPSDTLGLTGISFDVLGSGGINVTGLTIAAVKGSDNELGATGFTQFNANGTHGGTGVTGASTFQNVGSYTENSLGDVRSVLFGVGVQAETVNVGYKGGDFATDSTANGATPTPKTVSLPAKIATGTYTGTVGSINPFTTAARDSLLPASIQDPGPGTADYVNGTATPSKSPTYSGHTPTSVNLVSATVGTAAATPSPLSAVGGLVLFGFVGAVRRFRRGVA